MGWADAPIVQQSDAQPAWMSAPIIQPADSAAPTPSLMDSVADKLRSISDTASTVVNHHPGVGAVELLGTGVTGTLSQIPAGLAGAGAGAMNLLANALGAKEPFEPAGNVVEDVRNALTYRPQSASGQAGAQALGHLVNAVKNNPIVQKTGDVVGDAVDKTGYGNEIRSFVPAGANALLQLAPLVKALGAAGEMGSAAADAAEQEEQNIPDWQQAGFRSAEDHPMARSIAGSSGKQALTIHNQQIGNMGLGAEAGVRPGVELSEDALKAGRAAPNTVYSRLESALPTVPLSPQAQDMVSAAGSRAARITKGSPDALAQISLLKADLLSPESVEGSKVINELKGLRQEGYANIGSEDISNQQLGNAQLDMARALEQHIDDTLPENADVSLDQLKAARTALAKNSAVQAALRGKHVDLQAIARMQRADPGLLTGFMKTAADFASNNKPVTGLASNIYEAPGLLEDTVASHRDVLTPGFWAQALAGSKARNVLTGNTEAALERLRQSLPSSPGSQFAPIQMPVGPPPPILRPPLALPSPAMINAGGGATTPNMLESLGLTPDVQAAASQHPAMARLQALREQLVIPQTLTTDFVPPSTTFEPIKAGDSLGPYSAGSKIPNTDSISSSLDDGYTVEPGIQKVPLKEFYDGKSPGRAYSVSEDKRIANLASQIKQSKRMDPLIVVRDEKGSYVLEGGHRLDAAYRIPGATHVPALVVRHVGIDIPKPLD